jgi:hypothetical protein
MLIRYGRTDVDNGDIFHCHCYTNSLRALKDVVMYTRIVFSIATEIYRCLNVSVKQTRTNQSRPVIKTMSDEPDAEPTQQNATE